MHCYLNKYVSVYILSEMSARPRLLGSVRLRDTVDVAQRRQARLQVQLGTLRQVRLLTGIIRSIALHTYTYIRTYRHARLPSG